ncbi:hypothetical protein [Novosphingobium sp. 9]|uniref:hypothetical protein n=1 Tax=Novosphingobium sp. 9 TaxID=2025349 RepID=UPI0021B6A7FC|nr:hypothetical protein [Novosphingobium sp. 9]
MGGGLGYGQVHEIYAAEPDDASSTAGFAMATAMGMCARADRPKQTVLWLRERRWCKSAGILQANGWAELGGAP